MVNTMGKGRERSPMQIFFPNGRAEAKNTDPNNTGVYCHGQWPREDKNLLAQIQIKRQPDVPMQ
jgi:hypothetical protein